MIINQPIPYNLLGASDLAGTYKAKGLDKYRAWDQFIIDRALKPEISTTEFYEIFKKVEPAEKTGKRVEIDFRPDAFDSLCNRFVQVKLCSDGVWEMIWDDGCTGTFPPCDPPDPERFISISKGPSEPVQLRLLLGR